MTANMADAKVPDSAILTLLTLPTTIMLEKAEAMLLIHQPHSLPASPHTIAPHHATSAYMVDKASFHTNTLSIPMLSLIVLVFFHYNCTISDEYIHRTSLVVSLCSKLSIKVATTFARCLFLPKSASISPTKTFYHGSLPTFRMTGTNP